MPNQITDPARERSYGHEFNYNLWNANTSVTLANVPWNNDYRDVVRFDDQEELNAYINDMSSVNIKIDNMSYAKVNEPVSLRVPFNKAYRYNYLRASNGAVPNGDIQRDYYYFILDVRYIAPDTTEFVLQLDVFQTFNYAAAFGNCYVERGHIGIANEKAFTNYGRDYLSIPEGFEIGSEYVTFDVTNREIMSANRYSILVASTTDLQANTGTKENPELHSAKGDVFQGMPSGASYYVWNSPEYFRQWMEQMTDYPWVTQGIISITAIPKFQDFGYGGGNNDGINPVNVPSNLPQTISTDLYNNWRNVVLEQLPVRYRGLKKFLTSPYLMVEITTFTGTPIVLKPEAWMNTHATVALRASFIPPAQRVTVSPLSYNTQEGRLPQRNAFGVREDFGEYLDLFTSISNFPTMAIVNDGAISFMASNAAGLAFSAQSADWAQMRALRSGQVSYDQATSNMNLAGELTRIGRHQDDQQTALNNSRAGANLGIDIASSGLGAAGSIGKGGGAAAAVGAAGAVAQSAASAARTLTNVNFNMKDLMSRNYGANSVNDANQTNMGYIRDTNKGLADFAARGDYENSISGLNAKIQDAKLIQPSTSGQTGGETLAFINDGVMYSMRIKQIDKNAMAVVGEHWLRYGYPVRRFIAMPASLMVMTKATYWKLTETYITSGAMTEAHKQILRGIFEKGVTVWKDPDDIGNIDFATNQPLAGVSF